MKGTILPEEWGDFMVVLARINELNLCMQQIMAVVPCSYGRRLFYTLRVEAHSVGI